VSLHEKLKASETLCARVMTFGPDAPPENKARRAFEVLNLVDGQPSGAVGIAF